MLFQKGTSLTLLFKPIIFPFVFLVLQFYLPLPAIIQACKQQHGLESMLESHITSQSSHDDHIFIILIVVQFYVQPHLYVSKKKLCSILIFFMNLIKLRLFFPKLVNKTKADDTNILNRRYRLQLKIDPPPAKFKPTSTFIVFFSIHSPVFIFFDNLKNKQNKIL